MTSCQVCGKFPVEHRDPSISHAFSTDGRLIRRSPPDESKLESQGSTQALLKGDPLLRMALIRKGVITAEDLTQVEAEVRATGISHT